MPSSFRAARRRKQERLNRIWKKSLKYVDATIPVSMIRSVGLLEDPKGLNVLVPRWRGLVSDESDLDLRVLAACFEADGNNELVNRLIDKLTVENLGAYASEAIELGIRGHTELALISMGKERQR